MSVADKNWFGNVIGADLVISVLSTPDNAVENKADA
jgi:hypothetical protein